MINFSNVIITSLCQILYCIEIGCLEVRQI
nr:MAG TPA: hypothetical protein [Caudoviricetes sp.]